MKELMKPNLISEDNDIVHPSCDSQSIQCHTYRCQCYGGEGNTEIEEEDTILF